MSSRILTFFLYVLSLQPLLASQVFAHTSCARQVADVVFITAPVSSGGDLVAEYTKRNIQVVQIQPSKTLPKNVSDFAEVNAKNAFGLGPTPALIIHDGDFLDLVEKLNPFLKGQSSPLATAAGADEGIRLALQLNQHYKNSNSDDPDKADQLRHKVYQAKAIHQAGVKVAEKIQSADLQKILAFTDRVTGGDYANHPAYLKPPEAASNFGVYRCHSREKVISSFWALLHHEDNLGNSIEQVVAESELVGEEGILESISVHGEHFPIAFGLYDAVDIPGFSSVNYSLLLLPLDHPHAQRMIPEIKTALSTIGKYVGASHTELIGDSIGEINARLGGKLRKAIQVGMGIDEIEIVADAHSNPDLALAKLKANPPKLRRYVRVVLAKNLKVGRRMNSKAIERLEKLSSIKQAKAHHIEPHFFFRDGEKVPQIHNVDDVLGVFYLVNEDPIQGEADYQTYQNEIEPALTEEADSGSAAESSLEFAQTP